MAFTLQTWALWALQIVLLPLQVLYSVAVPAVYALKLRRARVLSVIPYDLANAAAGLLGCCVLPVVLPFVPASATHLPRWCWAWDNAWDSINGDAATWAQLCAAAGVDRRSFIARLNWLCVRNGTANFSRLLLGFEVTRATRFVNAGSWWRNGTGDHPGWLYIEATTPGGRTVFCYAALMRWGNSRRAIRTYLGWKLLWSSDGASVTPPPPGYQAQEVVYLNPLFGFNPPGTAAANH